MLGNTPDLPSDPATYFDAVKSILDRDAQIVFGNLEGTLTTSTISKCGVRRGPAGSCFAFRDPPGYARYLKQAGFTILNDANNHSFDFGATGQAQTVAAIHAAGLAQTGLPGEITIVKANGDQGRVRGIRALQLRRQPLRFERGANPAIWCHHTAMTATRWQ